MLLLSGATSGNQMLGRNVLDLAKPEDHAGIIERLKQPISERGKSPLVAMQMLRLDGRVIDVEGSTTPTTFNGRESTLVIMRDVSERKRAEIALQESENKLRSILNAMTDVIIVLDRDGKYLEVPGNLTIVPGSSVTPASNGDLVIEATSNTTVKIKLKGTDGTVRSVSLTLT
jgi:PAS domain-containing protein